MQYNELLQRLKLTKQGFDKIKQVLITKGLYEPGSNVLSDIPTVLESAKLIETTPVWDMSYEKNVAMLAQYTSQNVPIGGTITSLGITGHEYNDSILLFDGKVAAASYTNGTIMIYDPSVNSISARSIGGTYTKPHFVLTLTLDGEIVAMSYNGGALRKYNHITNTAVALSGISKMISAYTLPNGNIYISPNTTTPHRVYNPVTNTCSDTSKYGEYQIGGTLLLDNKLLIAPYNNSTTPFRTYNYKTGAYADLAAIPFAYDILTSILAANNKVYCCPRTDRPIIVLNLTNNQVTSIPDSSKTYDKGVLLPNGHILMTSPKYSPLRIINTTNDTVVDIPNPTGHVYASCTMLPNGKVLLFPANTSHSLALYDGGFAPLRMNTCLHPIINHF